MIKSSWYWLHADDKYAQIAQVLAVELCWQGRLIKAQTSIHLFSPSMCLSMDLTKYRSSCTNYKHTELVQCFPTPSLNGPM
jgi:hypothetical protein